MRNKQNLITLKLFHSPKPLMEARMLLNNTVKFPRLNSANQLYTVAIYDAQETRVFPN